MIVDRYDPINLFALVPQLSAGFAPELGALDQLLDDDTIFQRIKDDLVRERKVTCGRKLRVDSTVVETTIHHPTDSALLSDSVRFISRLLRRARRVVGEGTCPGSSP